MEKRLSKSPKKYFFVFIILHLQFWGCSFLGTKSFPEPILLDTNPVVALRYTYSEVELLAPFKWQIGPHAADILVLHRNNPASPIFHSTVFAGDSFHVILPYNAFSEDSLENLLTVQPLGGGYNPIHHFFNAPIDSIYEFPIISIP